MSTDENMNNPNRDQEYLPENHNDSQAQNNNGNVGREAGVDGGTSGSLDNISKDIDKEKPTSEKELKQNQQEHWTGNHGQHSSNRPGSQSTDGFSDQNLTNATQQNTGRNHVTNVGGTSQEDFEKGRTGLTDEENHS